MLTDGIFSLLAGAAPLQALLGAKATRKDQSAGIFPGQLPAEDPLPAVVFTQISGSATPTFEGPSAVREARMQFACYGTCYEDAKRLAVALRRFLEGVNWPVSGVLSDKTQVFDATCVLENDGFEEAPSIYQASVDFTFLYADSGD